MDRGISFVLSSLVFNVLPIALEVTMVTGLLAYNCGPMFAGATLISIGTYTGFTFAITQWRTKFRKQMNQAENEGGAKAVDSLLNFETVKVPRNQFYLPVSFLVFRQWTARSQTLRRIAKKVRSCSPQNDVKVPSFPEFCVYDWSSLAALNFGQNAILSAGLTAVMLLSAQQIQSGFILLLVEDDDLRWQAPFLLATLWW